MMNADRADALLLSNRWTIVNHAAQDQTGPTIVKRPVGKPRKSCTHEFIKFIQFAVVDRDLVIEWKKLLLLIEIYN